MLNELIQLPIAPVGLKELLMAVAPFAKSVGATPVDNAPHCVKLVEFLLSPPTTDHVK
jgi:hypothetical protein